MYLLFCPECYKNDVRVPLQASTLDEHAHCSECGFILPRGKYTEDSQGE